jgi:hypothetical protein
MDVPEQAAPFGGRRGRHWQHRRCTSSRTQALRAGGAVVDSAPPASGPWSAAERATSTGATNQLEQLAAVRALGARCNRSWRATWYTCTWTRPWRWRHCTRARAWPTCTRQRCGSGAPPCRCTSVSYQSRSADNTSSSATGHVGPPVASTGRAGPSWTDRSRSPLCRRARCGRRPRATPPARHSTA